MVTVVYATPLYREIIAVSMPPEEVPGYIARYHLRAENYAVIDGTIKKSPLSHQHYEPPLVEES